MTYSLFRSKTFYTLLAMFVVGGLNALMPIIPPDFQALAMMVLSALAATFHLQTATQAGAVN